MRMKEQLAAVVLALSLAGCPGTGAYRPDRALDQDRFDLACEGDFDQAPVLAAGKTPVFPIRMLNPETIADRKIRHLPMEWAVTTTFNVGIDGKTSAIASTPTSPQSFSDHMVVAVQSWRFVPASRNGLPIASRCSSRFVYRLD